MPIIETEKWKPNPDRPGTLIFDYSRDVKDIFKELEAHLTAIGRMPDEYFDLCMNWRDGKLFPKDATLSCEVNYGGSEGIYLDISIIYKKDVYEYSRKTGDLGWHNRTVIERFATGKTLGESNEDLDRMNLIASSVTAAFYGYDDGVHARYAVVSHSKLEKTTKTIFGEVKSGDWVISTGNSDFPFLIGVVTEINKHGTVEHAVVTTSDTDVVHVDFTAFEYPPERVKEIEEHFSALYGEAKVFNELPLGEVLMAPDMLISISNLSKDEITYMGNLRYNCESFCNCFPGAVVPQSERHGELLARLNKNLSDYHDSIMDFGKREIIDMASKISAMTDAHIAMSFQHYSDEELEFYLQFQNPLEIVANAWSEYNTDLDGIDDVLYYLFNKQDALENYPLMEDSQAPTNPKLHQDDMQIDPPEKTSAKPITGKQSTTKQKQSITQRLKEAGADAKEYNAQAAQNNKTTKHKGVTEIS